LLHLFGRAPEAALGAARNRPRARSNAASSNAGHNRSENTARCRRSARAKIADALLATGADHQVRVGHVRQRQGRRQRRFRDRLASGGHGTRGLHDVPASTVVEADIEHQAIVTRRAPLGVGDAVGHA
jgi:hypothetical protein